MNIDSRRAFSILTAVIGGFGVALTAYLTRNAAKEEVDILKQDLEDKKETKKKIMKLYILPAAVGTATVASIIGSLVLKKRSAVVNTATALIVSEGLKRGKKTIFRKKDVVLDEVKDFFKKDEPRALYFEEHVGFFLAYPEKLIAAHSDINQRLQLYPYEATYADWTTLEDFLNSADAEIVEKLNKEFDIQPKLDYGWSGDEIGLLYGYKWLYIFLDKTKMNDGTPYTVINWEFNPSISDKNDLVKILDTELIGGFKPIFSKRGNV